MNQLTGTPAWLRRCADAADRLDSDSDLFCALQNLLRSAPDDMFLDSDGEQVNPARLAELRQQCLGLLDGFCQRRVEGALHSVIPIQLLRGLRDYAERGIVPPGVGADLAERRAKERAKVAAHEKHLADIQAQIERDKKHNEMALRRRYGLTERDEKPIARKVWDTFARRWWDPDEKQHVD